MELNDLKSKWNQILFLLEAKNRVAWLAFFDARLAKLDGNVLTLDFSDPEKFSGNHTYTDAREKFANLLIESIQEVVGSKLELKW